MIDGYTIAYLVAPIVLAALCWGWVLFDERADRKHHPAE